VWLAGGRVRAAGPARVVLVDPALWSGDGPGSTSVAGAWHFAGLQAPLPLTVADVLARVT